MKIKVSRKSYILLIGVIMICQNLNSMESQETASTSSELTDAFHTQTIVHQSFVDYQLTIGDKPLKLLFPGGRELFNPLDSRGDQQKHEGFYTIDYTTKLNPHLQGNVFNKDLWEKIPDNTLDLTHIEVPGSLFLYGYASEYGRQDKDDFLLRIINKKSKVGGKLFVDLRYCHFWPLPNLLRSLSLQECKEEMEKMSQEDPDFFADFSYAFHKDHLASNLHKLLGDSEEEIYNTLKKSDNVSDDLERLNVLRERVQKKRECLSEDESYELDAPYIIFFDKNTREKIFDQYDALFRRYGFERFGRVIELAGKMNNNNPFLPPFQRVEDRVIYEGMCFLDTIAVYEKIDHQG